MSINNSSDYTTAALVNMAGQITGAGLNYSNQKKLQQQQNEFNRQMAELQNKWNIDAWNRTNEYNTPANQVRRLMDAGLSPYLAYGQVSSGQASPLKAADAPEMRVNAPFQFMDLFKSLGDSIMSWVMAKRELRKQDLQNDILQEQLYNWQGQNAGRRLAGGISPLISDADALANAYGQKYVRELEKFNFQNMLLNQRFQYVPKTFNLNQQKLQLGRDVLDFRKSMWDTQKGLIDAKKFYQQKMNDWFEINQWSNLIYKGADMLLKFVPVPRLFGGKNPFKRVSTTYY